MPFVPPSSSLPDPDLHVIARRNDSLGARGRLRVFALLATVSLGFGGAFLAAGAWPVLPWSVVEIAALGAAFAWQARAARDWERLTVQGDRVVVDRRWHGRLDHREWNRQWLRIEYAPERLGKRACVVLAGGGPPLEFGALLSTAARGQLARRLRVLAARPATCGMRGSGGMEETGR